MSIFHGTPTTNFWSSPITNLLHWMKTRDTKETATTNLQHHCRRIYFNMEWRQCCLRQRVYMFLLSSYHAIDTVYVWVRECKCIGISHITYQIFLVRSWIRKQHFSVAKSGCRYSDLAMMKSPLKFLHKSIHFCMEKRQSAYRHAYIFSNTN